MKFEDIFGEAYALHLMIGRGGKGRKRGGDGLFNQLKL